ncbi:MAG TPA: hypothetical protein VIQ03_12140 [Gammaproteobacteria bacterium]
MKYLKCKQLSFAAWILIIITTQVSFSTVIAQTDDAYLKALEAEAEAIAAMPADASHIEYSDVHNNQADEKFRKQKESFEQVLQKTLPSTFTIYRKLSAERKAVVVETYFSNEMKLPVASRQIFNFYFNDRNN